MFGKGGGTAHAVPPLYFFGTISGCLGILFLSVFIWLSSLILVVTDEKKSFSFSCERGDSFALLLLHSVEKSPWEDTFLIRGEGDLLLTVSKFESLGWGYPYSPGDGKFSTDTDKKFTVVLNRKFDKINTCISVLAMPKIIYKNHTLDLCREFGDGALVEIRVEPRYRLLYGKIKNRGG